MSISHKESKSSPGRKIGKVFLVFVLIIVIGIGGLLGFLSITEYKPDEVEELAVLGQADKTVKEGDTLRIMTWNIGYGALGDNADFFMDGGSMVYSADQNRVAENMDAIRREITSVDPDIAFLQEIDVNSARSYHTNEVEFLQELEGYESSFANNFKTAFIPYPIPPIGKVDSGILTMSKYTMESSRRISLPCPFSWPVSMANLKRCLNVSVVPIAGSERSLYLVNLHLEAFDDGEGKIAQTRQLKELLESAAAEGDYVIAGGDFNQSFSNIDISAYPKLEGKWLPGIIDTSEFDDSLQFLMDNTTPSGRSLDRALTEAESLDPTEFQYYLIDGFIVSNNITVENIETKNLGFVHSDHNPVVMDITIKE